MPKHIQIRIDDELSDWLDQSFPHGFKQTFGASCFELLKTLSDGGTIPTIHEVAGRTVEEVLRNADPSSNTDK